MRRDLCGKGSHDPGELPSVGRQSGGQIKARARENAIARPNQLREGGDRLARRVARKRPRQAEDRGRGAQEDYGEGPGASQGRALRGPRQQPEPEREDRHLAPSREGHGPGERGHQDRGQGQARDRGSRTKLLVLFRRGENSRDREESGGDSQSHQRPRQGSGERRRDAPDASQRRRETQQRRSEGVVQPGRRLQRLLEKDWKPGEEEDPGPGERGERAPAASYREHQREAAQEEKGEVMRIERGGSQSPSRQNASAGLGSSSEQEEHPEIQSREQSVRSGLCRVEEEKRRGGRENQESVSRTADRTTRADEPDRSHRQPGGEAQPPIRNPERFHGSNDGLLQEVEERRPGVRPQHVEETEGRQARRPSREDLVVPERPAEEKPEPRGRGEPAEREDCESRFAPGVFSSGVDGVS